MADFEAMQRLSPRQRACLQSIARHISPKQTAIELAISENTVRKYLSEAMRIIGASNMRDAARMFIQASKADPQFLGGKIHGVDAKDPANADNLSE